MEHKKDTELAEPERNSEPESDCIEVEDTGEKEGEGDPTLAELEMGPEPESGRIELGGENDMIIHNYWGVAQPVSSGNTKYNVEIITTSIDLDTSTLYKNPWLPGITHVQVQVQDPGELEQSLEMESACVELENTEQREGEKVPAQLEMVLELESEFSILEDTVEKEVEKGPEEMNRELKSDCLQLEDTGEKEVEKGPAMMNPELESDCLQLEDTGEKECEKDPEHLEMNLDLESDCLLQENFRTIELEYIDEEKEQKADIEGDRRQDSWEIQQINRKQRKAGNQGEVYLLF